MPTWYELLKPYGIYTSKVVELSTGHSSLWVTTTIDDEYNNESEIRYTYRWSNDKQVWSEWLPLQEGVSNLFKGVDTAKLFFQYRVELMAETSEVTPAYKGIHFLFYPYELVTNVGDLKAYPKLWITKRNSGGNITLFNRTTDRKLVLKNLSKNEEVFIDTYDQIIKSSNESLGVYRYDDHNNEWLTFDVGNNLLDSEGDFDLDIRYYSPLLQD